MPDESPKRCRVCDAVKPLEDFHPHHATADGRAHMCKECVSAQERARFQTRGDNERALLREHGYTWKRTRDGWILLDPRGGQVDKYAALAAIDEAMEEPF
jgi:hypothetical protein